MKIAVVGMGYVGLANAALLAQQVQVVTLDREPAKVDAINQRRSPIVDPMLEDFLLNKPLDLRATLGSTEAYADAAFVIIATPTDYDVESGRFDTESVESVLRDVRAVNQTATLVIKSTVPVGFTERMRRVLGFDDIIFAPEFLREGRALYDNLYPSRIVIGGQCARAKLFADHPTFGQIDYAPGSVATSFDVGALGADGEVSDAPFESPIKAFHLTNPIARASVTMAECAAVASGAAKIAAE